MRQKKAYQHIGSAQINLSTELGRAAPYVIEERDVALREEKGVCMLSLGPNKSDSTLQKNRGDTYTCHFLR
jgi:hypothetical protein